EALAEPRTPERAGELDLEYLGLAVGRADQVVRGDRAGLLPVVDDRGAGQLQPLGREDRRAAGRLAVGAARPDDLHPGLGRLLDRRLDAGAVDADREDDVRVGRGGLVDAGAPAVRAELAVADLDLPADRLGRLDDAGRRRRARGHLLTTGDDPRVDA